MGMITDRDIVIRALAKGKDVGAEKVRDYMTSDVFFCEAEDTLEEAAVQMHENHVSRLLVVDSGGKVSGILSFGCILRKHPDLQEISAIIGCATGKKAA
jgi:CBS domain-containing protein